MQKIKLKNGKCFGFFYEAPPYLQAVQSAYSVVLEQNKHVLLSTTEVLRDERYGGTFLLVSASGKFLKLTRQYFS